MKQAPISVAIAILHQNENFLMQLRDDKAEIIHPGKWGLFGGHLEPKELPLAGLVREIQEEIGYSLEKPSFFRCYADSKVVRQVFFAPLKTNLAFLELNEGQDLALVPLNNIELGYHYSNKIAEKRDIGDIHRQIIMDFVVFARNNIAEF